uniref:Uncharacterized protein n=1 Tax=uncultured marine group II/III euryarchaeote KM3_100_D04 TaxID=1457841 RepID=A0A075GAV7_9EURY|nr:hypothetical protein [uncultured marine group II/III euryarchaeote KM3_100_D04]
MIVLRIILNIICTQFTYHTYARICPVGCRWFGGGCGGGWAYTHLVHEADSTARTVLDYVLGFDLLLLTLAQAMLVWFCFQSRKETGSFTGLITERADNLAEGLNAMGAIIEDIADLLEDRDGGGPFENPIPGVGASIPEVLLTALMNRTGMGAEHGTTPDEIGTVHESELIPPPE